MRRSFASWWKPPELPDPEEQKIAALALPLATLFGVLGLAWVPLAPWLFPGPLWPAIAGGTGALHLVAAALVRAGRVRAGAGLVVAISFLATATSLAGAGVGSPISGTFIVCVATAGLMLGLRTLVWMAVLAVAALIGVGLGELRGVLPLEPLPPSIGRSIALGATTVALAVVLIWLANRAIRGREDQLAESEARFRAITENAPDLIAEVDTRGRLLYASSGYTRALGYTPEALARLDPIALVHPDDRPALSDVLERVLAGDHRIGTMRLQHQDGSWRWFDFEARTYTSADGQPRVVSVGRDLTAYRDLQAQLQRAQRLDALGRLAGGVAHDFNNFLTVILGSAEWLREELPKEGPLSERVGEIEEAGRRSAGLTRQLLAFGRRQPFQPRIVDLNRLLGDMDRLLRRVLPANITLDSVRGGGLGRVRADPSQLEQVILNLAINARDAMAQGGTLVIETANLFLDPEYVRLHADARPGRHVMLAVSDTGGGMDADTTSQAFEPFFTTKPAGEGTGLGLAVVHGIVRQHGGHIELYSEVGEGTTVKIYLPRVEDSADAPDAPLPEVLDFRGTETVLVAEDEELVRQHVRQILEANGYRVIEAPDGHAALEGAQAMGGLDAVVTDLMMPGLGGLELARRLRELRPGLPVLFVSGYTENGMAARGLDGDALLLNKPFTPRELLRRLREALDRRPEG